MKEAKIVQYRDFWDVPRIFLASFGHSLFLFDCKFSKESEDFNTEYEVFLMPELSENDLVGSWEGLANKALKFLGAIPVDAINFDETRRGSIKSEVISTLLNAQGEKEDN